MKHYTHILFDWDGTLAKTLDIWHQALRDALVVRGHHLSDKEIGANYETFKAYFEAQGHSGIDAILIEALSAAGRTIPAVDLYPHAREVLEQLQASGKHLALVTTSLHQQIDPLLQNHHVDNLFDTVVCGDDTVRIKPDPEPINKALFDMQANKDQTLIVGDSEYDIRSANQAGIDSALFYPPAHKNFHDLDTLKLLKPTFIINDLRELLAK